MLLCSATKLDTHIEIFYPRLGENMCTWTSLFITTLEWGGISQDFNIKLSVYMKLLYYFFLLLLLFISSLIKAELLKVILEGEWDMSGFDFESVFMLIIRLHRLISIVLNFTGCWAVTMTSASYFVPIKFHKSNDHHPQPQFIMLNLYVIYWVLLNNDKWPYFEIYMMI